MAAARWISVRCVAGRRSMRAAMSACSVSGIRSAPARGRSASIRIVSSTKSGLPSVFASTAAVSIGSSRAAVSDATSSALSCGCSGSSSIAVARTRPPPQPGLMSSSSLRARQRSMSGASRTEAARCSISSSSGSSPQWTSSNIEHERLRLGELLGPGAGGPGDLLLAALALDRLEHPDRETEQVGDGLVLAAVAKLLLRGVERVVVGDSGRRLHHLGERPVRDAFAVGQAASHQHGRALEARDELAREPALADARVAVEGEERGAAVADRAREGVLEQLELALPADERRREAADECAAIPRVLLGERRRPCVRRRGAPSRGARAARPGRARCDRARAARRRGRRGSRPARPPAAAARRD